MEDGHTLFDYDVGLNDIVQLMIRPNLSSSGTATCTLATNGDVTTSSLNGVLVNGKDNRTMNSDSQCESEEEETMDVVRYY